MTIYILGFVLIIGALGAFALQRLYSSVPPRELKRLAARHDQLATALYRPVAYGSSLRALLWIVIGITLPLGLVLTVPKLPALIAFVVLAVISFAMLVWLPSLRLTQRSAHVAAWFAPAITWILVRMHGLLARATDFATRHRAIAHHSRMYEKEDLIGLLEKQQEQVDNRVLHEDLELARRALLFNDKRAEDIVLPRKDIYLVNADDAIGPVLLDRLHQRSQATFLVYKGDAEDIIGSLSMSDAITAKEGGRVLDLVRSDIAYVHENYTLAQVLSVFRRSGQQVVVVVNKFEEFVGLIPLGGVLHELLGETYDEAIPFESSNAVATYEPHKSDPMQGQNDEQISSPEATEVIE